MILNMTGPNKDISIEFSSASYYQFIANQLKHQLSTFNTGRSKAFDSNDERWVTVVPLLNTIRDSAESLLVLSQYMKLRDCYVISRTIFETTLNTLHILTGHEDIVDRAHKHALQKSVRDLDRVLELNELGIQIGNKLDIQIDSFPEIKEAIEDYTSKSGREITKWTPESIVKRIEIIEEKFGRSVAHILNIAFFAIYRHASEIAHGTVFGALFSIGKYQPPGTINNEHDLQNFKQGMINELVSMTIHLLGTIIVIEASEFDLPSLHQEYRNIVTAIDKNTPEIPKDLIHGSKG